MRLEPRPDGNLSLGLQWLSCELQNFAHLFGLQNIFNAQEIQRRREDILYDLQFDRANP